MHLDEMRISTLNLRLALRSVRVWGADEFDVCHPCASRDQRGCRALLPILPVPQKLAAFLVGLIFLQVLLVVSPYQQFCEDLVPRSCPE